MHRLTIQPWRTGIVVRCTCRARAIYSTSLPTTDFQTIIDAAVQHMDESPHPLKIAVERAPLITAEQWHAETDGR